MNVEKKLSHINRKGDARMVDVTNKPDTKRTAIAAGFIEMHADTLAMISAGDHRKGDVFAVAKIAGIQAAKRCADLIPLCHSLALTVIELEFSADQRRCSVQIQATCKLQGKTGVEMEALTAVSVAALTIYDMCKAVDKNMVIKDVRLIDKQGGQSDHP